MIRASRRKLPPAEPVKPTIQPWLLLIGLVGIAVACWLLHLTVGVVIFGIFAALLTAGVVADPFVRRRREARAAQLLPAASCAYARSFDFRHTDTFAMRAVFEELQPFVKIPMVASHRLVEDLQLDDEDLNLDFLPVIARRLRRSLNETEKNPYYGRVRTVEDLVHFLESQPGEMPEQT
jgi:hypothetical protein